MAYVKQCSGCGEGQDCCSDEAKWGYWTDNVYSDQEPFDLITPSEWVFSPTLKYLTFSNTCTFFPSLDSNGQPYNNSAGEPYGADYNTYASVTDLNWDSEKCWYSDSNGTIIFKKSTGQEHIDSGASVLVSSWDTSFCVRLNADLANDDMGDLMEIKPRFYTAFTINTKPGQTTPWDQGDLSIGNNSAYYAVVDVPELASVTFPLVVGGRVSVFDCPE